MLLESHCLKLEMQLDLNLFNQSLSLASSRLSVQVYLTCAKLSAPSAIVQSGSYSDLVRRAHYRYIELISYVCDRWNLCAYPDKYLNQNVSALRDPLVLSLGPLPKSAATIISTISPYQGSPLSARVLHPGLPRQQTF